MTDTLREHLKRISKLPRKLTDAEKELRRQRLAEARKHIRRTPVISPNNNTDARWG